MLWGIYSEGTPGGCFGGVLREVLWGGAPGVLLRVLYRVLSNIALTIREKLAAGFGGRWNSEL